MARGVDQVEDIGPPHPRLCNSIRTVLRFDRNAAFAFDIHAVEQLFLHVTIFHRARLLDEAVSEGGFPVVDVRHDGEIADM